MVTRWVETYTREGLAKAEALRELNAALGTRYDDSHLSRWERGLREPRREAREVMMRRVLPELLPRVAASKIEEMVRALL